VTVSFDDPTIQRYRDQIESIDRAIVASVNARLRLVRELHVYKGEQGVPLRDPERERWLVERIAATNPGPLSERGVEELVRFVLDLVRREGSGG
jgi:chorismate mutase/prephenate dehydratase